MSANWIDALLAAVMLLSVVAAVVRGFMYSAFGLAAVVLAFFLAAAQGGILTVPVDAVLDSPGVSAALSHAVVFVAALLGFGALAKIIRKGMGKLDLGGLDRLVGFVFGLLRGGVVVVAVVLALGALPVEKSPSWRESEVIPVAGAAAYLLLGKGGMMETKVWAFDESRRPSLNIKELTPDALKSAAAEGEAPSLEELESQLGVVESAAACGDGASEADGSGEACAE